MANKKSHTLLTHDNFLQIWNDKGICEAVSILVSGDKEAEELEKGILQNQSISFLLEEFWLCKNCGHLLQTKTNPNQSREIFSQCTHCESISNWINMVEFIENQIHIRFDYKGDEKNEKRH